MEEVKVAFYRITSCGYYPWGGKKAEFGCLNDTLTQLREWTQGKKLAHTKTYEPRSGGNELSTYLVDVSRRQDAWLLTLWNEVHNTDGTVTSINGNAQVGNASVSETEVEDGHIPGHATYFWILPEDDLVVSLRFQHLTTGVPTMSKYLQNFLCNFTSHVVLEGSDGIKIIGYQKDQNTKPKNLNPQFRTKIFSKLGSLDYILNFSTAIRKIKKKSTLNLKNQPNKSLWQKLLVDLHLANHSTLQHEVDIQYEMDVLSLSRDEVKEIIVQWSSEATGETDYGFVMRGDQKVHWLGREVPRDTLELDVVRYNTELVRPEELLIGLANHKQRLLNLLL